MANENDEVEQDESYVELRALHKPVEHKRVVHRQEKHKTEESDTDEPTQTNKSTVKWIALGLGLLLFVFAMGQIFVGALASDSAAPTSINAAQLGGSIAAVNNGVQEVSVSMQGYQYQPNPVRLKVGVPARLVIDLNTVQGCMRNIRIPELGVAARVSAGNNIIEFTPTKAGTFRMTCSMGMGQGIVVVEDQNGQVPAPAPNAALIAPSGSGSCGSGGGGCGCGG